MVSGVLRGRPCAVFWQFAGSCPPSKGECRAVSPARGSCLRLASAWGQGRGPAANPEVLRFRHRRNRQYARLFAGTMGGVPDRAENASQPEGAAGNSGRSGYAHLAAQRIQAGALALVPDLYRYLQYEARSLEQGALEPMPVVVLVGSPVSRSGQPGRKRERRGLIWPCLQGAVRKLASNGFSGRDLAGRGAAFCHSAPPSGVERLRLERHFHQAAWLFRRGYSRGPCGRARRHFRNLAGRTLERQALGHWRNLGPALALVADVRLWPGQKPGSLVRQIGQIQFDMERPELLLVGSISRHDRGRDAEVVGREMGREAPARHARKDLRAFSPFHAPFSRARESGL